MKVFNAHSEPYNFGPELQPLFDALSAGRPIKSITCMGGSMNRDNRDKDFTMENVLADSYWVSFQTKFDPKQKFDYVDTKGGRGFYMNWVLSFEI